MTFNLDPLLLTNLGICFAILILGIIAYVISTQEWSLFLGIAFGLFGVSHLLEVINFPENLEIIVFVVRIIAYFMVAFTIFMLGFREY